MFKYLIGFSAITIALVAAYFSVTGIATLFAGKFIAVLAMASVLEIGKLVSASFLYRYWEDTAKLLKIYLISSVAVLMMITSIGIYGYLSAAYAEVAAVPQNTLNQITAITSRQVTLNSDITRLITDNTTIDSRRTQVQSSLDNVLLGNTQLSQRSAFANLRTEIEQLDVERRANNATIAFATVERDSLENVKVILNSELNINSEIGTFIYIARTLGLPLDTVVKWFVLIIVFVFDPMAISLILAYNSIVVRENKSKNKNDEDPAMELLKKMVPSKNLRLPETPEPEEEKIELNPVRPEEKSEPTLDGFVDASSIISKATAPPTEIPEEAPDEPEPLTPIRPGWSFGGGQVIDYDHLPFYMRPGYDWVRRTAEWKRNPKAVEYHRRVIAQTPQGS